MFGWVGASSPVVCSVVFWVGTPSSIVWRGWVGTPSSLVFRVFEWLGWNIVACCVGGFFGLEHHRLLCFVCWSGWVGTSSPVVFVCWSVYCVLCGGEVGVVTFLHVLIVCVCFDLVREVGLEHICCCVRVCLV